MVYDGVLSIYDKPKFGLGSMYGWKLAETRCIVFPINQNE